jgi:branched-subunit amino acid aminotransferase/4-amino-4-deoxychorismate lyase
MEGGLVTPPVSSGLLAGVFRRHMLDGGRAREHVVTRSDLSRASRVFLGNSVRGLYEVKVREDSQ